MPADVHPPRPELFHDDSKATVDTLGTLVERVPVPWWQRDRVRLIVCCWALAQLGFVEASAGPLIRTSVVCESPLSAQ